MSVLPLPELELKDITRVFFYILYFTLKYSTNTSLKECVYKAMHPILCEYVAFQEAEITPLPDGTAKVVLDLRSRSHKRLGIIVKSATWRKLGDGKYFLTTALVGVDSSS